MVAALNQQPIKFISGPGHLVLLGFLTHENGSLVSLGSTAAFS